MNVPGTVTLSGGAHEGGVVRAQSVSAGPEVAVLCLNRKLNAVDEKGSASCHRDAWLWTV